MSKLTLEDVNTHNLAELAKLKKMLSEIRKGQNPVKYIDELTETIITLEDQIRLFEISQDDERRLLAHVFLVAVFRYKCLFLEITLQRRS